MVYSQYELYIWEGVTEIFSIKLCSNVWGDFLQKGVRELICVLVERLTCIFVT